jgi:hypothetical protein
MLKSNSKKPVGCTPAGFSFGSASNLGLSQMWFYIKCWGGTSNMK